MGTDLNPVEDLGDVLEKLSTVIPPSTQDPELVTFPPRQRSSK